MNKIGHATYRRGKLYFDEIGWALVKSVAKRMKKSPQHLVIAALKRWAKKDKNEKA